jgi:hypothetical protein
VVVLVEPKLKPERNEPGEPDQPSFQIWANKMRRAKATQHIGERQHDEKNGGLDERGGATRVTEEIGQSKMFLNIIWSYISLI